MKLNFDELIKQKFIDLYHKGLVDNDLAVLVNVIEQSTVLEVLGLGWNEVTLSDGKLANAIAKNTTLKELNLYNNNISQEGVRHLANALKVNNTLKILMLHNNNIGDEGAEYIANMLAVNKSLQKITLNGNNISDEGARSLATSFVVNTGIQRMWLNYNNITDAGAEKLVDALEFNHNIKHLEIYGNNISNHMTEHMTERIIAIVDDPKRREIAILKQSIAEKDEELESKDTEIAGKDAVIAKISRDNAKKDKQITSLKAAIRGQLQQLESILYPVDLTSEDDNEPPNKRARTDNTPKSALAFQHEQNKQYSQRLVQIKQEKNDAETNLENVRVEKQAVESNLQETRADLEDVRDDLDIANETVTQQAVFTDRWQSKYDDLKALAEANGVDGAAIAAITNR